MEKEPVSIATIQMKPDYAASEVYSTSSIAPPAYKHHSNSVKIAKICALTVVVSSFVIGSFILASTYMQARASCDQMHALDSVLEKELMLETLQQEIPKAEALQSRANDNEVQSSEKESTKKTATKSESDSDSSFSESDEAEEMNRVHIKLPLELILGDLAGTFMENQPEHKKSKMNCVVERRRAEEIVDTEAKNVQLPFGVNLTTEPKKQKVTGEKIQVFCESGADEKHAAEENEVEQMRPILIPLHQIPIPFGAQPNQVPLTHMPQQMMPPRSMVQQMQQMLPQRPPVPAQMMQAPRPEQPEIRIHLQRLPMPAQFRELPFQIREMLGQRAEQPMPMQFRQMQQTPINDNQIPMEIREMRMHGPLHPNQIPPQIREMQMQANQAREAAKNMPPQMREIHIQGPPRDGPIPFQAREVLMQMQQGLAREGLSTQMRDMLMPNGPQRETPILGGNRDSPMPITLRDLPLQNVQVQRIPLAVALQRAGITTDDLKNIQRMAEERIQQELQQLAEEESGSDESGDEDDSSEEQGDVKTTMAPQKAQEMPEEQQHVEMQPPRPEQPQPRAEQMPVPQMLRIGMGRSLFDPVNIPVPMMEHTVPQEAAESERPHYVQPRSVRS